MAWNPTPEVAVAREAAKALEAVQVVIVAIRADGTYLTTSFGQTKALCDDAKALNNVLHKATYRYFETH